MKLAVSISTRLIVAGVVAVVAASRVPVRTENAQAGAGGYAGSAACQSCHEEQYASWRKTLHVQMTKPIAEATVEGDFTSGTRLQQYGRTFAMERKDDRYFITVTKGDHPPERFEVNYTLGARRFQGYLSKLPDGRIYVLPIFWHNESKRWIDYKEITPIPDDPDHDLRQIWNVTCVNCHATNLVRNFNPATNTYGTTWTEMGIGCEACHGPGQPHIDDARHQQIFSPIRATPRQNFDACGYCHGNKNNLFFGFKPGNRYEDFALPFLISQPIPDNDPQGDFWPDGRPSRFNRPQALTLSGCFRSGQATCTSCHRMHAVSPNAHSLKVQVEAPDGSRTRESDQLCTQCHGAGKAGEAGRAGQEGSARGPREDNESSSAAARASGGGVPASSDKSRAGSTALDGSVRLQPDVVVATPIPDLAAHTHHAADSQGSRCVECHMSDVNWRLVTRRRDHTFQPPVPELTAKYGVPNACTTCHEDKPPEWAAKIMDAWYGNGERRRAVVAIADVIYRAGTGDVSALPAVATLAADRSHGTLIRASAAEFAGQLLAKSSATSVVEPAGASGAATPAAGVVNALIGAAADPEPQVRAMAVRALALAGDPRLLAVLAARLGDDARIVRVSAADALMSLGVASLEGAAGAALARAQDEWASSLATFNDVADQHTTLGWLDAARGQTEAAHKELATAILLDPADAKPHVYLGVLAARAGKFDEALQQFKAAKNLSPAYRNLDRLIDEAQKRATIRY